jgi:gamma-glutamyltranspeptidase / glutathione hydrolase
MISRRQLIQAGTSAGLCAIASKSSQTFARDIRSASVRSFGSRTASGPNVVATVHPLATRAAIAMFQKGGNAIDAAIAAALTLGVVDGHNSGIGGGCLILMRTSSGKIHAIDGREKAPAAASPEMYIKDGKPSVSLSQTGPLAMGVPGQIAALHKAHSLQGALAWLELFGPAMHSAREGYEIGTATHGAIASEAEHLLKFEASKNVLLNPQGNAWEVGEILKQPDLADTLKHIANNGPDWFYRGEFAYRCAAYLKWLGGVLTKADFANYQAIERTPLESTYRNQRVIGFPTPSSGGTHIAQMLNILENFDLSDIYEKSPAKFFHLIAESMKLAFADRAHWLGDSDFVKVPSFLTDKAYAMQLAKKISMDKASQVIGHGTSLEIDSDKKHTTHLTTADAAGNWVAITNTVNTSWGSKVMVPGTGVILNNEMDDFSIAPGVPNAFGLLGSEANAVAPNKRPLSSMSPTIVLRDDGQPWLTCGAAGGPKIINATLQNLVRCIDLKQTIENAIGSARIHHQWRPDTLFVEPGLGGARRSDNATPRQDPSQSDSIPKELESMGHAIKVSNSLAIAQGIQSTEKGLMAASDPRTSGSAMAKT